MKRFLKMKLFIIKRTSGPDPVQAMILNQKQRQLHTFWTNCRAAKKRYLFNYVLRRTQFCSKKLLKQANIIYFVELYLSPVSWEIFRMKIENLFFNTQRFWSATDRLFFYSIFIYRRDSLAAIYAFANHLRNSTLHYFKFLHNEFPYFYDIAATVSKCDD